MVDNVLSLCPREFGKRKTLEFQKKITTMLENGADAALADITKALTHYKCRVVYERTEPYNIYGNDSDIYDIVYEAAKPATKCKRAHDSESEDTTDSVPGGHSASSE